MGKSSATFYHKRTDNLGGGEEAKQRNYRIKQYHNSSGLNRYLQNILPTKGQKSHYHLFISRIKLHQKNYYIW